MKALSVALGLLIDDARLVIVLAMTLLAVGLLKVTHHTAGSPYVMIAGLLLALLISIEHQLTLKRK